MTSSGFEYESLPLGYYDKIFSEGLKVNKGINLVGII